MMSSDTDVYIADVYRLVKWILSWSSELFISILVITMYLPVLLILLESFFNMLSLYLLCLNWRLFIFMPSSPLLSSPLYSIRDLEGRSVNYRD